MFPGGISFGIFDMARNTSTNQFPTLISSDQEHIPPLLSNSGKRCFSKLGGCLVYNRDSRLVPDKHFKATLPFHPSTSVCSLHDKTLHTTYSRSAFSIISSDFISCFLFGFEINTRVPRNNSLRRNCSSRSIRLLNWPPIFGIDFVAEKGLLSSTGGAIGLSKMILTWGYSKSITPLAARRCAMNCS